MKPKSVKRAAELLETLEGLREVRDCPGEYCEAFELQAVHDICEAGNSSTYYTKLPIDLGKAVIEFAIERITSELADLGVEVPA